MAILCIKKEDDSIEYLKSEDGKLIITGNVVAENGTPVTGESLEPGGTGILGWLSSIRKKISAIITILTDGAQSTRIVDADGHQVNVQQISANTEGTEYGALCISMIHGKSKSNPAQWVDVKVTPSGALTAEAEITNDLALNGAAITGESLESGGSGVLGWLSSLRKKITNFPDLIGNILQTPTQTKALRVQIGPGDVISNLPIIIDFPHHQRHEGETHRVMYDAVSLGTGTVKFELTIPDTYVNTIDCPHILFYLFVYNGAARLDLYEGSTFSGGSPMTSYNVNRNSNTVPGMTVKSGVTSTDGTLLPFSSFIGAGTKSVGDRNQDEFISKKNTKYRLDLIGKAAGTDAILIMEWYEDLGV